MGDRRGFLSGLAAYGLWGFFPLYIRLLRPSGAVEILSHRIVWSVVSVALLTTVLRRWDAIRALGRERRKLAGAALAAALIAVNWGTYIYGVNSDHVVETSLGYFINPLISVLFGVFIFGERLRSAQWVAIGIGAVAVGVITWDYGRPPWIALTLATTFGTYGLVKKRLGLPPTDGLLVESGALALPALAYVAWLTARGESTFTSISAGHAALLVFAGVLTAVPLMFFADAANRVSMTTLGMLQYTAPILQLSIGVYVLDEPMPPARLAGFALVWVALAVFTWDALRRARRARAVVAREPVPAAVAPAAMAAGD